jgi:hypothetical protein
VNPLSHEARNALALMSRKGLYALLHPHAIPGMARSTDAALRDVVRWYHGRGRITESQIMEAAKV